MERKKVVVAMPSRSRGSSTSSRWASSRAEEGLESKKNRPQYWCRLRLVRHWLQGASRSAQAKKCRKWMLAAGGEQHKQQVGLQQS
jgi:hypothetical protein